METIIFVIMIRGEEILYTHFMYWKMHGESSMDSYMSSLPTGPRAIPACMQAADKRRSPSSRSSHRLLQNRTGTNENFCCQTVERSFNLFSTIYPVNTYQKGYELVSLAEYLLPGKNDLRIWVTHNKGEGSPVSVRIILIVCWAFDTELMKPSG
jgi:hypothetical protein